MTRIADLIEYLKENGVNFRLHSHTPAYSAHEVAMATHSTDAQTVKTLVINACIRTHSIRMAFADFERLVRLIVMTVAVPSAIKSRALQEVM